MWQPEKFADYVTWDSALERGCLEKVGNQNFFQKEFLKNWSLDVTEAAKPGELHHLQLISYPGQSRIQKYGNWTNIWAHQLVQISKDIKITVLRETLKRKKV